jgi:hypothetical protein
MTRRVTKDTLRETLRWAAQALRDNAIDQHDYLAEHKHGSRHVGTFDECTTLRCEDVRKVLAEAEREAR